MRIDGAIFDLDGTLLDSMPVWGSLGADYLCSFDIRPEEGLFEKTKLMTLRQAARYFRTEYGLTLSVPEIEHGINARIENYYFKEAKPKAGTADFLRFLQSLDVKMCVVTATDQILAEAALSRCGLRAFFTDVITCGDFGSGKDTPAIFEFALKTLGTEKKYTPVFEDAIHAVHTAKEADFPVVAIYDQSFAESEDELRLLSDVYVHTLSEARDYFA